MAEKEGLFGLRPHPCGAAFTALRHSLVFHTNIEPLYIFLGFEGILNRYKKRTKLGSFLDMAEKEGFEPSIGINQYTLSRRAPSATRTLLQNFLQLHLTVCPIGQIHTCRFSFFAALAFSVLRPGVLLQPLGHFSIFSHR